MNGLVLMTDNSRDKFRFCVEDNWFRHIIINDSTFFLKKELLKTIIAVHRFDIHSSVWRKAKIFDIDQAAFTTS